MATATITMDHPLVAAADEKGEEDEALEVEQPQEEALVLDELLGAHRVTTLVSPRFLICFRAVQKH